MYKRLLCFGIAWVVFTFSVLAQTALLEQKISVNKTGVSIKEVITELTHTYNLNFSYSIDIVQLKQKVTIKATDEPLRKVLNNLFAGKGIYYAIIGNQIVLQPASGVVQIADSTHKLSPKAVAVSSSEKTTTGENNAAISGRLTDSKNIPLPFVSVVLLDNNAFVFGTATDENGKFTLPNNLELGKTYALKLSFVGYISTTKSFTYPDMRALNNLVLQEEAATLKTVTVTGKKPLVVRKTDRYIVDIENSTLANGNTGLEVLQKSPGVWVSSSGAIRIKGNQMVSVMINDVVQRMSEEDLAEYLKTLKSEDINRIEVIQNPPAEFEAAGTGGIIHIVLKKSRQDGLNGSVNGLYRQQNTKPFARGGASLNYKVKNLYVFGSGTLSDENSIFRARTDIRYTNKNLVINNATHRDNNNNRQQYLVGLAYDISENQSIGLQTLGAGSQLLQYFETDIRYNTNRQITGTATSDWIRKPRQTSTTLNYAWKINKTGAALKFIADYTQSSKKETNDFASRYSDSIPTSQYRNSSPNSTSIYSIQTDYVHVLPNKIEVRTGAKYAGVTRDNILRNENFIENNWVLNEAGSNHFIYDEDLLMFYSSAEKAFGATRIKAGLRAEETFSKGTSVSENTLDEGFSRTYFGLFPSFFILRQLDKEKGESIYLNYARRLQRPAFNELNPYRLLFDNFTSIIGNPNLLPQYTHNLEVGYNFFNGYLATVYFAQTNNLIAQLANPVEQNKIEYQYQNFKSSREYGFTLSAPVKILNNWTSTSSLSLYHLESQIQDFNINQTTVFLKSLHTVSLKNGFQLDASADYRSPYVSANSRVAYNFSSDLGISKRFLQNKARLQLYVYDPFNLEREKEVTKFKNVYINFYQKRPTRTVSLSFSYNFSSGKKFSSKKLEESNSDEKKRIGN